MNGIILFGTAAARDYGDIGPQPNAALGLGLIVALVAGWLFSLFIAYLIVRAGVRAGVQVLVDQGRAARELMQAQTALLNQLVKRDGPTASPSSAADDEAAAWDKLRRQ